jgi:hypothetical protein
LFADVDAPALLEFTSSQDPTRGEGTMGWSWR